MKLLLASAAAFILTAQAFAAKPPPSYRFTIIGNEGYYFYYSFDLPVTPSTYAAKNLNGFALDNISVNTVSDPFDAYITFVTTAYLGGLEIDGADDPDDDVRLVADGPQLFNFNTGTPGHPITATFVAGQYQLIDDYAPDGSDILHSYTLTIGLAADAPAPPPPPALPVPEPISWMLMLAGFGAAGGTMRARRRKVSFG